MGATATYLLPYPEPGDPADVPADVKELADRLEVVLPTMQEIAEYGQPNGYAPLGADGKVPAAHLPAPAVQTIVLRKYTMKDVVNTAAAVDLFNGEITIPASALTTSGRLYCVCGGDYLNNSGSGRTCTLALSVGAASVWQSNAFSVGQNANRRAWRASFELWPLDSTHLMATGQVLFSDTTAPLSGQGAISQNVIAGAISQTSLVVAGGIAAAAPLTFTVQHQTASGQLSMRLVAARVEIMP